ncbi:hypothetical protein H1164_08440 [Thermoactinomyces daqus]|uniref:Uncharacterized protein n=1 Tax=Thermoactinomyces daqus TaxID=1329516 RepID=A0A7W1XA96_9BACL|nr:hypothetical protein [Thermoactinomyces daqus]MBA4542929.1 hypothetical protein [Thermoactinomyces daqus]
MKLPTHLKQELNRMKKTFMKDANLNDLIKELIKRRRKQILVHSCLYYRMNHTEIDDHTYDQLGKDLQLLQKTFSELSKEVIYHEYFKDYTETTSGFDLPIHLPEIVEAARRLKSSVEWLKEKGLLDQIKGGNNP